MVAVKLTLVIFLVVWRILKNVRLEIAQKTLLETEFWINYILKISKSWQKIIEVNKVFILELFVICYHFGNWQ